MPRIGSIEFRLRLRGKVEENFVLKRRGKNRTRNRAEKLEYMLAFLRANKVGEKMYSCPFAVREILSRRSNSSSEEYFTFDLGLGQNWDGARLSRALTDQMGRKYEYDTP